MKNSLPGHSLSLHSCVSLASPIQFSPPLAGLALVQVLVRTFSPWPHVSEHPENALHADHLPSTMEKKYSTIKEGGLQCKCVRIDEDENLTSSLKVLTYAKNWAPSNRCTLLRWEKIISFLIQASKNKILHFNSTRFNSSIEKISDSCCAGEIQKFQMLEMYF